tara:strand:- start:337 stop:666 length:330 start_codon:yes stop_codon:yes gene_type:complete
MGRLDEFLAHKINHCVEKGIKVDESLLKMFKNEFNVIRQRGSINRSISIEKRIIEYRRENSEIKEELSRKVSLGSKDESYLTESEMLIGYVAPSYEDLSSEEKKIYDEK